VIVVDASALTDALIDDGPVGDASRALLTEDLHWAAPAHLVVEVLSAIRGRVLGGKLTARRGGAAVRALRELTIDVLDPQGLVDRIWQLRDNLTAYDAAYVAAAENLHCALVTGDARLGRIRGLRCTIRVVEATQPR
jgi:predicted nucleic acid-binding protein